MNKKINQKFDLLKNIKVTSKRQAYTLKLATPVVSLPARGTIFFLKEINANLHRHLQKMEAAGEIVITSLTEEEITKLTAARAEKAEITKVKLEKLAKRAAKIKEAKNAKVAVVVGAKPKKAPKAPKPSASSEPTVG